MTLVLPAHGWLDETRIDLSARPAPTVLSLGFGSFGYYVEKFVPWPPLSMLTMEPLDSPAFDHE